MSGLDEGRLTAYLDGELGPDERADLEAWLEESDAARAALERVREHRGLVSRALRGADAPAPDLQRVRTRMLARANGRADSGGAGGRGGRHAPTDGGAVAAERGWGMRSGGRAGGRLGRRRLAQAAMLVLLLGAAGASAAVPGSPVRAWLSSLLGDDEPAAAVAPAPPEAGAADDVGLRVRPSEGRLTIDLSGLPADGVVTVRLVEDDQGAVYAPRASFRSGTGLIEATLAPDAATGTGASGTAAPAAADPGGVRVEIPRSASGATLRVDGDVWLLKQGERLDFPGPAALVSSDSIVFRGTGG